ncbi:hypothetical protein ACKWTF_006274 [Chironomus riparius]
MERGQFDWVSLREKYRREKLYWENIEKNGNSSNAPLKEYWPLMKDMKFIDAVSTKRHSYRKTMKNERMGSTSGMTPSYSPNISLTTSPQNFPGAMQVLEPLDNNEEQTHFLMNNSFNGVDDDDLSMDSDNGYNSLDINKTKYQSFGIYIGNELCALRDEFAEELHERLLSELLKFKRELRQAKCAEM